MGQPDLARQNALCTARYPFIHLTFWGEIGPYEPIHGIVRLVSVLAVCETETKTGVTSHQTGWALFFGSTESRMNLDKYPSNSTPHTPLETRFIPTYIMLMSGSPFSQEGKHDRGRSGLGFLQVAGHFRLTPRNICTDVGCGVRRGSRMRMMKQTREIFRFAGCLVTYFCLYWGWGVRCS